jgi:hypothetical protein
MSALSRNTADAAHSRLPVGPLLLSVCVDRALKGGGGCRLQSTLVEQYHIVVDITYNQQNIHVTYEGTYGTMSYLLFCFFEYLDGGRC